MDDIFNILLQKDLIKIPLIVQNHFPNGIPKNYIFEEFCNYHRILEYVTKSW